jgi:hypothetical protein
MRQIFGHLAGPLGGQKDLWRGRRVRDGRQFPLLRLLVLAECATKSIIDVVACAWGGGQSPVRFV